MIENIYNLTLDELRNCLVSEGLPRFSATQIYSWLYKRRVEDFLSMTDISKPAREFLKNHFYFSQLKVLRREVSRDGTEKFLFGLKDKNAIEAVAIPEKSRTTLCVSSQVGCKFNCSFCSSGKAGFKRNLTVSEIINQYLKAEKLISPCSITNIVFMGIGEPLDNFDNVVKAIRILTEHQGVCFGKRRISISTCGLIPQIEELAKLKLGIKLSLSLHSPDDAVRCRLMPINKKYPIAGLIKALKTFSKAANYPVTFEYALISGVNTKKEDAVKLARLLSGLPYKINLIPLNQACLNLCSASEPETVAFKEELKKRNVFYTSRKSRGQDINAACGQLRALYG